MLEKLQLNLYEWSHFQTLYHEHLPFKCNGAMNMGALLNDAREFWPWRMEYAKPLIKGKK